VLIGASDVKGVSDSVYAASIRGDPAS